MSWANTPNISGTAAAKRALATLLFQARSSNKRIALVGDSQEDSTGDSLADYLCQSFYSVLGKCHETAISQPFNYGSTASHPSYWLTNVAMVNSAAKSVPDAAIPPGRSVASQTTYAYLNFRTMVQHKAENQVWQGAGDYTVLDLTAGFYAECFLYTNSGGSAACKWIHAKENSQPGSFFGTSVDSGAFDVDLSASDDEPVRVRTPDLVHDASNPYNNIQIGHDANTGIQLAGTRVISNAGAGGVVWQMFSVGGYDTTDIEANHADAGPMFRVMGGASGWDAIAIGICNNNAFALEQDKSTYKTALSGLIETLRGWNDNQALILLIGDPPVTGSGWPAGALDKFNTYAEGQAELAESLSNVVAINSQRLMHDSQYDPASATFSSDGLHPNPLGGKIRADAIARAMFGLESEIMNQVPLSTAQRQAAERVLGSRGEQWQEDFA